MLDGDMVFEIQEDTTTGAAILLLAIRADGMGSGEKPESFISELGIESVKYDSQIPKRSNL